MFHYITTKINKTSCFVNICTGEIMTQTPSDGLVLTQKEYNNKVKSFQGIACRQPIGKCVNICYRTSIDLENGGFFDTNYLSNNMYLRRLMDLLYIMDENNNVILNKDLISPTGRATRITSWIMAATYFANRDYFSYHTIDKYYAGRLYTSASNYIIKMIDKYDIYYLFQMNPLRFSFQEPNLPCDYSYVKLSLTVWKQIEKEQGSRSRKVLSAIFRLIPWIHRTYLILCKNPYEEDFNCIEPLSKKELTIIMGGGDDESSQPTSFILDFLLQTKCSYNRMCFPILLKKPNDKIGSYMFDPRVICTDEYWRKCNGYTKN